MANNLYGGLGSFGGTLGGLMGGLAKSGLLPTDTPEGKLLAAQSELASLSKQESEIMMEIGRQAYEQNPSEWPQNPEIQLIRQNIDRVRSTIDDVKREQERIEEEKKAQDAIGRCESCGYKNQEGVRFCQECGATLSTGGSKQCATCGAEVVAGGKFCGECGARQN